jgi:hypothetical protein
MVVGGGVDLRLRSVPSFTRREAHSQRSGNRYSLRSDAGQMDPETVKGSESPLLTAASGDLKTPRYSNCAYVGVHRDSGTPEKRNRSILDGELT